MSDSTSAGVFGEILLLVLSPTPPTPRESALRILEMCGDYDFSLNDLDIDELLAEHDLVRQRWDEEWRDWDVVYAHEHGFDEAEPYIPNREDRHE